MIQKISCALAILVVGLSSTVLTTRAEAREREDRSVQVEPAGTVRTRHGPYDTYRRAKAVANSYRKRGSRAKIIYVRSFGQYYVEVVH
jgi:hypothetical protein